MRHKAVHNISPISKFRVNIRPDYKLHLNELEPPCPNSLQPLVSRICWEPLLKTTLGLESKYADIDPFGRLAYLLRFGMRKCKSQEAQPCLRVTKKCSIAMNLGRVLTEAVAPSAPFYSTVYLPGLTRFGAWFKGNALFQYSLNVTIYYTVLT